MTHRSAQVIGGREQEGLEVAKTREQEGLEVAKTWKDRARTVWTDGSRLDNGINQLSIA